MPLRYNARELSILAGKSPQVFDKEGVLLMKDKQEGLFRKGEAYLERLFRLRGNLLFFFKTRDPSSEVLGVYVLERCMVQLDMEEEEPTSQFGFLIMFEGEDRPLQLAARSEKERAGWIECLHIASYECMKMQLQSLREQIRSRSGKDPMAATNGERDAAEGAMGGGHVGSGPPLLELSLACEGLRPDSSGKQPDTFVSVHYSTPKKQHWFPLNHTEVVMKCTTPIYLSTIGLYNDHLLAPGTKVKLMVYDVKERMTNTMAQIGTAVFSMEDLLHAPDALLHLPLDSVESDDVGFVVIRAWRNEAASARTSPARDSRENSPSLSRSSSSHSSPSRPLHLPQNGARLDVLNMFYDNLLTKTFRFPTNMASELRVHEHMAESRFCFYFPVQLLKLWIEEEKHHIDALHDLGELASSELECVRQERLDFHMSTVTTYSQHAKYLYTYTGAPFKPSAKKSHKEVEFAPTNLHLQRLVVQNEMKPSSMYYDVSTVGAFTAYALRFKHGGIRRMVGQLRDYLSHQQSSSVQYNAASLLNQLSTMYSRAIGLCEQVCRAAIQGDPVQLNSMMRCLREDTRKLILHCSHDVIAAGVTEHSESRTNSQHSSPQAEPNEGNWKWSGTDFVKSPTEEPWELTCLNTEAALMCVVSMVEDLLRDCSASAQWLEQLSPLMIKLKSCVQVMCNRGRSGLMYISIKDCAGQVPLLHSIKYRRDVCMSQALTAAVSAFVTCLHGNIDKQPFLHQLARVGILMSFEGLMSCYSAEMGMIEDMAMAVADLQQTCFKLVLASSSRDSPDSSPPKEDQYSLFPLISSNNMVCTGHYPDLSRGGYIISIPLPQRLFSRLPQDLQDGKEIKMTPVFFNIGINEQATLAEKIGDLTVQEEVNQDNFRQLHDYYSRYIEFASKAGVRLPDDHEQMMRLLHVQIMSKKSKNVEALHLSADLCRLMNGLRFTSCKSAKDRSSMSVTLEQIQVLLKEHDLAGNMYLHALDCMRSQGLRRDNTAKNTGSKKYAFNSLQLLSMPKLYRPPSGTYGYNMS